MPSTERKLEANRANAQKSTGPRTEEGKRKVSRNALTHGFTAAQSVIDGHEQDHFDEFAENMTRDLNPRNQLELSLADQIISCAWRLNRILRLETEALKGIGKGIQKGAGFMISAYDYKGFFAISTHESRIQRSMYRALKELKDLRESTPEGQNSAIGPLAQAESIQTDENNEPPNPNSYLLTPNSSPSAPNSAPLSPCSSPVPPIPDPLSAINSLVSIISSPNLDPVKARQWLEANEGRTPALENEKTNPNGAVPITGPEPPTHTTLRTLEPSNPYNDLCELGEKQPAQDQNPHTGGAVTGNTSSLENEKTKPPPFFGRASSANVAEETEMPSPPPYSPQMPEKTDKTNPPFGDGECQAPSTEEPVSSLRPLRDLCELGEKQLPEPDNLEFKPERHLLTASLA